MFPTLSPVSYRPSATNYGAIKTGATGEVFRKRHQSVLLTATTLGGNAPILSNKTSRVLQDSPSQYSNLNSNPWPESKSSSKFNLYGKYGANIRKSVGRFKTIAEQKGLAKSFNSESSERELENDNSAQKQFIISNPPIDEISL